MAQDVVGSGIIQCKEQVFGSGHKKKYELS